MGASFVEQLARAGALALAGLFLVPLSPALADPAAFPVLSAAVVCLWAVAAMRPAVGLLVLVTTIPLALAFAVWFDGMPRHDEVSDALLLAFVSGASLRLVTGAPPGERLAGPALVLAVAVLASSIAEFSDLQNIRPRQPLPAELWRHLTVDYIARPQAFPFLHHGIRWLAWLAAAVYAERALSRDPAVARVWIRWWAIAGTSAAVFYLVRLLEMVSRSRAPVVDTLWSLLPTVRFSVLQPDVNAAGSYYLLFLVPVVASMWHGSLRWAGAIATPWLMLALALTRSRAAMASFVVAVAAAAAGALAHRSMRATTAVVLAGGLLLTAAGGLGAVTLFAARSNIDWRVALGLRLEMLEVGLRAARREPLFGAGLSNYPAVTRRLTSADYPRLAAFAPQGENAHNNFLQILVELGAPALCAFVWLILTGVRDGLPFARAPAGAVPEAQTLGILAFLASALLGHPLLIPIVGTTFFVALGAVAGLSGGRRRAEWTQFVLWTTGVFFAASIIWRW